MPSDQEFTPNAVWASSAPSGVEEELTLPSGQTCRAKRMSIEAMIQEGLLANSDALTAVVGKHIQTVKGKKGKKSSPAPVQEVNPMSLMKDPQAIKDIIGMVDQLLPHMIVSPVVMLHYSQTKVGKTTVTKKLSQSERDEICKENADKVIVFTDQIGFEDKMFLFDWAAGGVGVMLAFRG